ncbi:hypothetical protein GY45DRAFT_732756 [Cubamyces sp. BRFM 1775]|nr:hypothetical protein GY45DRAFT_732756 [Cubamyces sp. BRFM 1775]
MSHLYPDVQRILDELTERLPGQHTIYLRSRARSSHPESHTKAAQAAPTDDIYLPECVIESRTESTARLCRVIQLERESHGSGAGDFYVPLPAVPEALAVGRISRILLYASNHTSALLTQDSLAAWASTLDDARAALEQMHHAIQTWERDVEETLNGFFGRLLVVKPSSVISPSSSVDEKFGEYDPASQTLSNAMLAGDDQDAHGDDLLGTGFNALAPLSLAPGEALLTTGTWLTSSPASNEPADDVAHPVINSPMLCDLPADFTLSQALYAGRQSSYTPSPSISPAYTLVDLTSSSPSSDILSSPLTAVPSHISSPVLRSSTPKADDAWMLSDSDIMDLQGHALELDDLFVPLELNPSCPVSLPLARPSSEVARSLSPPAASSSSEAAHSPSPHPETILISPADDSMPPQQASALTSSPPARARLNIATACRVPTATDQPSPAPANPSASLTRRLTRSGRAIQRTEEKLDEGVAPYTKPIRSLPARAARRHPRTGSASSPLAPTAGPSRSTARSDDDDAQDGNDSEFVGEDNDESGDYVEGVSLSPSSRKRRLKSHSSSERENKKAKPGPFLCAFPPCTRSFSREHDARRHETDSCPHNPSSGRRHPCEAEGCNLDFSRFDAAQRHFTAKHREGSEAEEGRRERALRKERGKGKRAGRSSQQKGRERRL